MGASQAPHTQHHQACHLAKSTQQCCSLQLMATIYSNILLNPWFIQMNHTWTIWSMSYDDCIVMGGPREVTDGKGGEYWINFYLWFIWEWIFIFVRHILIYIGLGLMSFKFFSWLDLNLYSCQLIYLPIQSVSLLVWVMWVHQSIGTCFFYYTLREKLRSK